MKIAAKKTRTTLNKKKILFRRVSGAVGIFYTVTPPLLLCYMMPFRGLYQSPWQAPAPQSQVQKRYLEEGYVN